jgi:glycine/D-amino acid oxidase-like deaminating enzyme
MTPQNNILTADFKSEPYWWDAAPLGSVERVALPSRVDVVVVGSGFTGLSAALTLARGGRTVAVLEQGQLGRGASTRNNGALVPYLYLKLDTLMKQFGETRGIAISMTAVQSLEYFLRFLDTEEIECGLKEYERFFSHCHQLTSTD